MKTPDEWATWIIAYMQKNPVDTLQAATDQIEHIVKLVQDDAVPAETPTVQ